MEKDLLNNDGQFLSIFTRSSLYLAIQNGATHKDIVDPYLIKDVISISEDTPDNEVKSFIKVSSVGSVPVVNKEGKVIGLLCKSKMVMTLFRHSKLLNVQLKAILDSMHNGVIAVDSQDMVTHINIGASRILHLETDSYIGQPFEVLFPNFDLTPSLIQGETKIGIKYKLRDITMVVNITSLNIEGNIAGAIVIFQDLTDLEYTAKELEIVKALNKTGRPGCRYL